MTQPLRVTLIAATLIFFLGVAGRDDYQQELDQAELCREMAELFETSQGERGWPPEVCTRG